MAAIQLTAIMDGLATAMTNYGVQNVYAFPVKGITVPCSLVDFPSTIDLMTTYGRNSDHVVIPVWFLVGDSWTKDSRDVLSVVMAGGNDIVAALEGASGTGFGDVDVLAVEVSTVSVGDIAYLGLKFTVDIIT